MKLLYLTPDGFDTPTPNNQLIETLLNDFVSRGHAVHMICGRKTAIDPDVPESLSGTDLFTCSVVERGTVDKTNLVKRYLYDARYVLSAACAWMKHRDADAVLVQSNPLGVFHTLLLKALFRKPIVYNTYEIFPGSAHSTGVISNGFVFKALNALQGILYGCADAFIVVSEDMKNTLLSKNVPEEKLYVVANWYDESAIREISPEDNRFAAQFGIDQSKFIVQFAGTIGYVFDYQLIVEVAELLHDEENVEIHLIGQGTRKAELECVVQAKGLRNVRLFPWQPLDMLADVYSACSVGIVFLEKGVIYHGYPSKSSLLMACGKPVIYSVENDSAFAEMIIREQVGFVPPQGNPRALADTIKRLAEDRNLYVNTSKRAKKFAESKLGRKTNSLKFIDHVESIAKERG